MYKNKSNNNNNNNEWHTSTYEWHMDDIRLHTSDIRMTCVYIRVIYEWHMSTYEWHTDGIRVHTSGIRMTYRYTRVTYRWHAVRKKNKLFKTFLIIHFQNIRFVKELLACNGSFGLFTKIKKGSDISVWCTFSTWFLHYRCSLSNTISVDKVSISYLFSFSRYQIKRVIKFKWLQW